MATSNNDNLKASPIANNDTAVRFLCITVFLLGIFFRLHGLDYESIDLEEYACLSAIDAPDFSTFFQEQRELYPYGAPLAPTLIYFWAKVAGDSIAAIRLFVALIGILVMAMGYLVATQCFKGSAHSSKAALLVLICIAFSPVHVFHSQEARMYALVSLFALCGMATFLKGLRSSTPTWWILHLFFNAAFVASHYFAVFLLPVYGLVLLLRDRRPTFRIFFWGIGHSLLALILLAWVAAIPKQADELYSYYEMPTAYTVFIHTFCGDSTTLSATSFFPSLLSWNFLPQFLQFKLLGIHTAFDLLLLLISISGLCGGFLFLYKAIRRHDNDNSLIWFLLLLWALAPVFLIVGISFLWQPVYGSRYVMYSMFAFYLLFSGIAVHLPRKAPYWVCVGLVTVIYGYQLSIALPPQTRTSWRQAYEHVLQESNDDAILLLEDPFFQPVLELNTKQHTPIPIVSAFNRNTLCHAVSTLSIADNASHDKTALWVLLVLTTNFNENDFADCLTGNKLHYARYYYPGERNLALYHILPEAKTIASADTNDNNDVFSSLINAIATRPEVLNSNLTIHELQYLSDQAGGFWMRLGVAMALYDHEPFAQIAFRKAALTNLTVAIRLLDLSNQVDASLDANRLASLVVHTWDQHLCEALQAFMQTAYYTDNAAFVEALGNQTNGDNQYCPESVVYRGIAAYKRGKYEKAVDSFVQYPDFVHKVPPEIIEAYAESLTEVKDYATAIALLKTGLEIHPAYKWLYMRLGIAEAKLGNHEDALAALRIAYEHAPDNTYILYLMIESLVETKQYKEAATLAMNPVLISATDSWVLWARWRALTGAGQDQPAKEIFKQLADTIPAVAPFYNHLYVQPDAAKVKELVNKIDLSKQEVFPEVYMLLERL